MIKRKVTFLEGRLLTSQTKQFKKVFKKVWLAGKKPALQKSHFCFNLETGYIFPKFQVISGLELRGLGTPAKFFFYTPHPKNILHKLYLKNWW